MDLTIFTVTERKIMELLLDGYAHPVEQLHKCLSDDMGPLSNVRAHITFIRKKIRPLAYDIVCRGGRNGDDGSKYQLVRLLASPSKE